MAICVTRSAIWSWSCSPSLKLRALELTTAKDLLLQAQCSFGKIYSCLNEQLRRGGVYKNGAVVLHLDLWPP